ncbi:MAG: KEOPS complex subunit Pcc1 [Candidatus Aenigmatarchaeota archaeon]
MKKVLLEINLQNSELAERIYKSLLPDIKKDKEKLSIKNSSLIYEIEDENFSHILAACTSILKLINEALKLENSLEDRKKK